MKRDKEVICQYCGGKAKLVTGKEIYHHRDDLSDKNFWYCKPCGAYVGCHRINPPRKEDGTTPLGALANKDLRRAKIMAHTAFDSMWKYGKLTRKEAYNWLANELKIDVKDCHIGYFSIEQCRKVVEVCFVDPK